MGHRFDCWGPQIGSLDAVSRAPCAARVQQGGVGWFHAFVERSTHCAGTVRWPTAHSTNLLLGSKIAEDDGP